MTARSPSYFTTTFLAVTSMLSFNDATVLRARAQKSRSEVKVSEYEAYRWQDIALPKDFLASIATAINFAFSNGAAREISEKDFFHFHLLCDCEVFCGQGALRQIKLTTALLFHTQEDVSYGHEAMMKRNILLVNGGKPSFVRPSDKQIEGGNYTVHPQEDLGLCTLDQGYIIDITDLDTKRLKMPKKNIIHFKGRIIFIGFKRSD